MNQDYYDTGPCVEAFVNHYVFKSWEQWIYESFDRWDPRSCRRCDYFHHIAAQLEGDFKRKGYLFIHNHGDLRDKLLVWAYAIDKEFSIHYGTRLTIPAAKHRNTQKDHDEYFNNFNECILGEEYNRDFKEESLFCSSQARTYFFLNLISFLYRLIDINRSPHIKKYDDEEARAKEEEIERLLDEGVLTLDFKGRIKKSNKLSDDPYPEQIDYDYE